MDKKPFLTHHGSAFRIRLNKIFVVYLHIELKCEMLEGRFQIAKGYFDYIGSVGCECCCQIRDDSAINGFNLKI